MCGFPIHAAEHYIHKIVTAGYKVAICRQTGSDVNTGLMKREVVRIVTPSTILNENYLQAEKNNFLASIAFQQKEIGLSYCDFSTGEFFIEHCNSITELINSLNAKQPAEILLAEQINNQPDILIEPLKNKLSYYSWFVATKTITVFTSKIFPISKLPRRDSCKTKFAIFKLSWINRLSYSSLLFRGDNILFKTNTSR